MHIRMPTLNDFEKGDFFLDKNSGELFIFNGEEWLKIIPNVHIETEDEQES